jgi:hypothetical protein
MSKEFKWTLLVVLGGFLALMLWPFPWLTSPSPYWNGTAHEINIKTGQGRQCRYIAFIRGSSKTFDTPLSEVLTGAVDVAPVAAWQPVFTDPRTAQQPPLPFSEALFMADWLGYECERARVSPTQQAQLATQMLTAWQTAGSGSIISAGFHALLAEKTNSPANQVPRTRPLEGDRLAFARSMHTLQVGMTATQVVAILGAPDDVRTQNDPGEIGTTHTKEIWRYGTDGHLTFPTLGCVYMDDEDKVQYIYGGEGTPPAPDELAEADLRALLRLIDKLPRADGVDYNPRDIILVVNRLQGLGKEKALAVLDEYLRVASHFHSNAREGLFLVLRVLFEVPADPGYLPGAILGSPDPMPPKDDKLIPRFPILIQDDIPLMLVCSYMIAGLAPRPEKDIRYFHHHGKLRDHPLQPTNSPLAVLGQIEHSPQWVFGTTSCYGFNLETMLIKQLLRLVDTVYRVPIQPIGHHMPETQWDKIREEFDKLGARWDRQQNCYVFTDGTQLPEIKPAYYRRNIWPLPTLGPKAQLVIERTSTNEIEIIVDYYEARGLRIEQSTLRVIALSAPDKPLLKKNIRGSKGDDSVSLGGSSRKEYVSGIKLPAGARVQAELISGEKRWQSPVYTP